MAGPSFPRRGSRPNRLPAERAGRPPEPTTGSHHVTSVNGGSIRAKHQELAFAEDSEGQPGSAEAGPSGV